MSVISMQLEVAVTEECQIILKLLNILGLLLYEVGLIGSSELQAEVQGRKNQIFLSLNCHHQMLMVRARSNALSSEIPRWHW